jgi:iron complex transport system substrate-binding protein
MVGVPEKGMSLAGDLRRVLDAVRAVSSTFPRRPRVYFEEWHDPMISGIRWVSELIEIAGGDDIFPEFRTASLARDRTVADPAEVLERKPDLYMASWCGRKFRRDYLDKRPGWPEAEFLKQERVYEIDSATILQPGPAALTDGILSLHRILAKAVGVAPADPSCEGIS